MPGNLSYRDLNRPINPGRTGTLMCTADDSELYDSSLACTPIQMPTTEVLVCSPEDLLRMLQEHARRSPDVARSIRAELAQTELGRSWNEHVAPTVNHPATVPAGLAAADGYMFARAAHAVHSLPAPNMSVRPADLEAFSRILHRLGVRTALMHYKVIRGKQYIVLKGYPGLRRSLNLTHYPIGDPKVVTLGIGTKGLQHVARGGAVLSIVTTVGLEVVGYMLNDQKTMADLIGGIGVELVKSGIALGAGFAAAVSVSGGVFMAVLPLGAMIIASVFVGVVLNTLDKEYDVKNRVIQALNNVPSNLKAGIYRLEQGAVERLRDIHATYEREVEKLQSRVARAVGEAVDRAVEDALNAARQRALAALSELIRPALR